LIFTCAFRINQKTRPRTIDRTGTGIYYPRCHPD